MSRADAGAGDDMACEIKGEFGAGEPGWTRAAQAAILLARHRLGAHG